MSRSACEVCGETYDYCGQCGTCHKCMGEDIDRLKAELKELRQGWSEHSNICREYEHQLSSYKEGVEANGTVEHRRIYIDYKTPLDMDFGQRVRVLVMKGVE